MTRTERIQQLHQYYLDHLIEDSSTPTRFDETILGFLKDLENEWKYHPHGPRIQKDGLA